MPIIGEMSNKKLECGTPIALDSTHRMVKVSGALLIAFSIFCGLVSGRCIQCQGKQVITFAGDVNSQQANDFFKSSLGDCATGDDYDILYVSTSGRTWTWDLRIWRYCGIGKSYYVDKGPQCFNGVCSTADKRTLKCSKIVYCYSTCTPWECGV